jgi:uncharacterized protein YceH (UPF0502 family)
MTSPLVLDPVSLRVLGSLMEKEMTTPDLYPLSVNALLAAANQRSSRDPVMDLSEEEVRSALDTLEAHELVAPVRGSRVPRFEHRIRTVLTLRRDETAILCLLLLRGAQTAGELRSRADRMFQFDDLAAVQSALERLAARDVALTAALPRMPGSREVRWRHLLGDGGAPSAEARPPEVAPAPGDDPLRELVQSLEDRVRALEERVLRLEAPGAMPGDRGR